MGTITVKDAAGSNQTAALVAATGSTSDANSLPVAQSTEHKALVGALTETAPATDTASSGLNGRLQRIAQRITTFIASLGTHDVAAGTGGSQGLGYGSDTAPSAVASPGNAVRLWASLTGALFGVQIAHVIGGYTPFRLISAASTNATSLKGSAGKLGMLVLTNKNAATRSVKFYNKATTPTVGSDTVVLTFEVPGNTAGAGMVVPIPPQGIAFTTGIAYAITVENTDVGTTGVAAGDVVVSGAYI